MKLSESELAFSAKDPPTEARNIISTVGNDLRVNWISALSAALRLRIFQQQAILWTFRLSPRLGRRISLTFSAQQLPSKSSVVGPAEGGLGLRNRLPTRFAVPAR